MITLCVLCAYSVRSVVNNLGGKLKKIITVLILYLTVIPASAQLTVTPQVGINGAFLTNEVTGVAYDAELGYQIGVNLRFGDFFHVQPGIYYETLKKSLTLAGTGLGGDFSNGYINIPVLVGVKLIPLRVFDLRINTGLSFSLLTSVGDNDLGLTKDDLNSPLWGWIIGVGLDFVFISTDISYEFGFTNVIETVDIELLDDVIESKANILRVNVGIRL